MHILNILNESSPTHGEIKTEGAPVLDLTPVVPGSEDRGRLPTSNSALSLEKSPTQSVVEPELVRDTGGYLLPHFLESYSEPELLGTMSHAPEGVRSLHSPNHRYTDSRSSYASCTSSSTHQSHSRFSSISTAWEMHPTGVSPKASPFELLKPDCPGSVGQYPQQLGRDELMSPMPASPVAESPKAKLEDSPIQGYTRLKSPSDAIIMPILAKSPNKLSTHNTHCNTEKAPGFSSSLVPPDSDLIRAHKRTASAPGPHGSNSFNQSISSPYCTSQPTTPRSQSRQHIEIPKTASSTVTGCSVTGCSFLKDRRVKCWFMENCDTGSTLRKAISHIFGRNKLCTRMIPDYVWVHYCRKHYQRSRYRNAKEYALTQCKLVRGQINLVQEWSDENRQRGEAMVVQDWTLSMRKREQNRIQDKSRKRLHSERSDDEKDNTSIDYAVLNGTAVPDWLRKKCGNGYSTDEIIRIARRIEEEVETGKLSQIPDIEILPNIPTDGVVDAKSKTQYKRKPPTSSIHKRSRSLSVTRHPEPDSSQRSRQTFHMPYVSPTGLLSTEKRQRIMDSIPHHEHLGYSPSCEVSIRPADPHSIPHLPYRPALHRISQIQESGAEESGYKSERFGDSYSNCDRGPLPILMPPLSNYHAATQLGSSASGPSRSGHYRSVSEYTDHPSSFRFSFQVNELSPPAAFATAHAVSTYPHSGLPPTNNYPMPNQSPHLLAESEYPHPRSHQRQSIDRSRHSRHQSTPNATRSALWQPHTHQDNYSYDSDYVYGGLNTLRDAPTLPREHLDYRSERPVQYTLHPEIQGFRQTRSYSDEGR
ncbi:hypothetical protein F5Y12DRAFT_715631 [Xylaria sp. FL1777]|nr:hypothetical protein F5Y12DRAFT_715631 [Xylaria sp. FL1777]